jgi:hypothetical protein
VLTAVELALEAGVASKTHVLNVLHRLLDGKPVAPAPVTAPQALRLANEPQANVLRYDSLRGRVTAADPIIIQEVRHDPASAAIVILLRELKMHGMAHAVAQFAQQGALAFEAAQPMLSQLLKAETAEREVRSVAYPHAMSECEQPVCMEIPPTSSHAAAIPHRLELIRAVTASHVH